MWCRVFVVAFGFGLSLGGGCDCGWVGRGKHPSFPATAKGWQAAGPARTIGPAGLADYLGKPTARLFLSYELRRLFVQHYVRAGAPRIVAEFFESATSEDAYGLFSHHRAGDDVGIGQANGYREGRLSTWQGGYFVRVWAERETAEARAAVLEIGRALVAGVQDGHGPRIVERLPRAGLDPRSVRFLHVLRGLPDGAPVPEAGELDLSRRTDVAMGVYQRDGESMRLIAIRYKNAQQAERARRAFGRAALGAEPPPEGEWVGADAQGRMTGVARRGRFLHLVVGSRRVPPVRQLLRDAAAGDE